MTVSLPIRFFAAAGLLALLLLTNASLYAASSEEHVQAQPEAEESEEAIAESPVEVDLKAIESAGLFYKTADGGLGKNFLQDSSRASIEQLIKAMPGSSPERPVEQLILGVLLTETASGSLEGNPEPGRDLLTLRLEKLLEGGAYSQAFELYSKLEAEPYHENLARAGVLSMLYTGEKSLACLEARSAVQHFTASGFLRDVISYCDFVLVDKESKVVPDGSPNKVLTSMAENSNYRFAYTPETFDALNSLDQALLAAENKLDLSGLDVSKVPLSHLQILLRDPNLDEKNFFALTAKAVGAGFLPVERLTKIYEPTTGDKHAEPTSAPEGPLPEDDLHKLSVFYKRAAASAKGITQWDVVKQAFPLAETHGIAALTPFAEFISQSPPEEISLENAALAFRIMHTAGLKIPSKWADLALNIYQQHVDNNKYSAVLATVILSQNDGKRTGQAREKLAHSLKAAESATQELVNNVIENVDKAYSDNDNANNAYENEYYLTLARDYVMPSVLVWDRMKEASQKKAAGETILLSTVLLSDQTLQETYPALLRDIMQGLENVGLTNVSQDLAISACLGNIN